MARSTLTTAWEFLSHGLFYPANPLIVTVKWIPQQFEEARVVPNSTSSATFASCCSDTEHFPDANNQLGVEFPRTVGQTESGENVKSKLEV